MTKIYEVFHEMLPLGAFNPVGGRMRLFKKDSDAPDYTPMAQATAEAARISADLGREYLAENQRQYDQNMEVARPIIAAQAGLTQQAIEQGDDYYNYMKEKQRPIEDALQEEALTGKPDAATQQAMEEAASKASADARAGTTQQANMIMRQGMRYGLDPVRIGKVTGAAAVQAASGIASAADNARTSTRAQNWARRMDVSGLYRGLPGASQGAYGLAVQSGNSAVGNQNQTSGQFMGGIAQGNATTMSGQQMKINGLSNILNSQTSIANSSNSSSGSGTGAIIGALGSIGAAFLSSSELKEDKKPIEGELIVKGLQRIPVEAWSYKEGVADEGEHVGPYAEDVHREFGDAAAPGGAMLDPITMNGLTIAAVKNLADRMDRVEKRAGLTKTK